MLKFQDILPSHNSKNLPTQSSDDVVRFLGLDPSEPIAQIGGTEEGSSAAFFSGHYENTVGTSTFFSVEDSYLEENGMQIHLNVNNSYGLHFRLQTMKCV